MRGAPWRRWVWWVCLAAAAGVATPAAAARAAAEVATGAGGQGACEVLDLGEASHRYVLPTNLTVKPSGAGWRLDLEMGRQTEAAVCVGLEDKQPSLRLTAEGCGGGHVRDYSFLDVSVPPGVWTSLRVAVADDRVTVSAPGGINASVLTHGPSLPRDGTQVVLTGARNVDAAVGCRSSCPGYRHASPGNDKRVTVKEWSEDTVQFYFRPGDEFVKLRYELACTTPLGIRMFPQVSDITLDPNLSRNMWHPVHLQHSGGVATVSLDDMPLRNKTLPQGCTFKRHTIRVVGDGLFSFTCSPLNGQMESTDDEGSSGAPEATTQARMPGVAVAVITVESIAVVMLLITVFWFVKRKHQTQKPSNETTEMESKYHSLLKQYKYLEENLLPRENNMHQSNQQHDQQQTQQHQHEKVKKVK